MLLIAFLFLFVSCTQGVDPLYVNARDSKTLIIGIENAPKNLDPRKSVDSISGATLRLFTQGLVYSDDRLMPVGDLALSFEAKQGKWFKFLLNPHALSKMVILLLVKGLSKHSCNIKMVIQNTNQLLKV